MAEEYGLANLLSGQPLPSDAPDLEQLYGAEAPAPRRQLRPSPIAPSIPEGYRMLRLPNGGLIQVYKDVSDAEAYARARERNPAWFATPEENPTHKAIPKGHAADEERPDSDFEQNLTRSKFEADDDQARKQKVINDVLLAERQVPSAFRDQEAPLLPPTPAMEQVAAKRALTEKLAHRAIDAQYPIPQAFQGAPTNADIARANEAMIRPDPSKQGFLSGLESGAAGFVAGAPSAVATNLEALPFPLDEFGQQAAGAIRGAVAPMRQVEKEAHKPLSELELIEARNKGILPGAQAELTHAGDVMGPFIGKWLAPMLLGKAGARGRAASAGLTYSLLFDEFDQRAKEAKIPMTLPELHAGAAISTALFQLAPTFITKGLPVGLIAPSAKTIAEIYRTQGPEAAQAAIGGITQNILKSAASGFVGATGAMVGTEAAQRQLLGQPQLTFDEAAQIAKDAGIITAFTAPFHGRGAREEGRRAYVQEAAKDIRQRIVDREADAAMRREGVRVDAEDINRQNAQRRWPGMSTEGAQGRDQAQGTEHIETPGVAEPAPPTGEINLLQPVDWHPTGDGFPNTVEGLKDFIAHHKDKLQNEVARRNPEVAAPIEDALKEANKRLTALRRTAQKGEAPTPPGIPPSAETLPWPVEEQRASGDITSQYDALKSAPSSKEDKHAFFMSLPEGTVFSNSPDARVVVGAIRTSKNGTTARELETQVLNEETGQWETNPKAQFIVETTAQGDKRLLGDVPHSLFDNTYIEVSSGERKTDKATMTLPEQQVITPEAPAAPWPVEALGLKPNAALTKRLAKLDMNNPEHIEAISDELNKTRVQIEPEKLAALSNHFDAIKPKEVPSAEQITETGAPDGGSGAQPVFREEGGDQTVGGKGMERRRQRKQAAETQVSEEDKALAVQKRVQELIDFYGANPERASGRGYEVYLQELNTALAHEEDALAHNIERGATAFTPGNESRIRELKLEIEAHEQIAPELERIRETTNRQETMRDAREDLDDAVAEGHLTPQQAKEVRKRALAMGEAGNDYIYGAVDAAENGSIDTFLAKLVETAVTPEKVTTLTGAPGEVKTPEKVATPERGTPEGANAWKKAFEAQRKSKQQEEDEALIRQIERDEYAERGEDGEPEELFFSKKADEETKPWWYSPVARVLKDAKIKRQTGKQWKGWLAGQEGVKKDELEHSGMNDFLDLIGDTQIEKGELEQFIGKHGVDIEETQLVDESLPEHPEERHEALMQYPAYARYHGMLEEVQAALKQGTKEHREVIDQLSDALERNDGPRVDELLAKSQELEDVLKSGAETEERLIAMRNSAEDDIVMGLPKSARFRKHTFRKGSKNYLEMLLRLPQKIGESVKFVYDTHYDDPNVLAFVRGTTRDNGKTFFVEELQSDWGQRGQKRGFLEKGEPIPRYDVKAIREEIREAERARDAAYDEWDTAIKAENARYEEVDRALVKQMREGMPYAERAEIAEKRTEERNKHYAKWKELSEAFDAKKDAIDTQLSALHAESRNALHGTGKVPKAPFIGDSEGWTALGLKKIIQHAIAQGHDRVTFINGRQSARRWHERQLATRVVYDAEGTLRGYDVDGDLIYDKSVKEPNLAAVLSPKAAEELLAQEPELGVRTLKKPTYIGGEGLIRHYNQTIPKVLNKVLNNLLKGSGTKIELERIVQPDVSDFEGQGDTQLSFKITPELRAAVEKGIPLFAKKKAQGELHTVETLQKELDRLYGKDVPEIEVSTREKEGVDEKTQGFFDPKTNRAVLIADNIGKGEDIHGLMRHEVAVHLKKLGATDEEFQGFLRQLEALRDNGAKDIVEAFDRVPKGTNPEKVTEEALAYLTQNKPNLPIVRRFMSWLRRNAYKISGSEKWLKGDDFAVMADEVLRTKVERPMTEGERMETRTPEEEVPLVTSERKSMVKAVGNAVKRIVSAAVDPRALSKEYTKFTQQVVAESRGLTKALEAQPTYDPDTGIRADYLRNQYDSAYQLTLEGLFGGVPIMERGTGVARIQPSTRLNVDRIMADTAKLPLTKGHDGKKQDPLTVMAEIFRIKLGEMERKELTQVVRRLEAIRALPAASRQTRDAKAEIAKLRKLIQEPRERRVTQEMVDWANQQIRDVDGVQDILDRWAETNQHLLAFERDTQFISKERYDELADRTAYIPLFMPMEEILERRGEMPAFPGGGPKSTGKEYSKSGRGSLMAVNVWENMAKRYSAAIANGMMNDVKLRAYEQLKRVDLAERVAPTYRGHDAVKARMDGKDFLFRVLDEDAYRSLTMAGMYSNRALDLIAIPANWVRRSALFLNPAYYVRSLVTEPVTATMTTMAKGAIGPVTPIDALYQIGKRVVGKNKSAKEMQSYGITGLSHLDQNMYRFSRALGESPKFNKWMQYLDKMHSAIDDATRTIIYESAQKDAARDGITDPQIIKDIASVTARDFADFAAKGSSQMVRVANKQTPFLHAHFVGMDKFLRAATGYGKANKEGDKQKQRFINMAVLGASGVIGITLMNVQDKRYRELPIGEWSKNFILGFDEDGRAIKLPISQEVGFIKFMAELMTRMLVGVSDQPEANKAFHGMAVDTLLPPGLADPISVATRGWLQLQTNTELHSGLPIVSPQEMLGLPEDQDERATYFSKLVRDGLKYADKRGGTKLAENFSPEMMDSFMRSLFTSIYDNAALTAAMIFDTNEQRKGVFDLPYNKDFTEVYPGAKVIFGSPRTISDMPRFYEMAKPLYQTMQSFSNAANYKKPEAQQRFDEMRKDPVVMERVNNAKVASRYRKAISDLETTNERLYLDKSLTESQRRKRYWDNVERIKDLARQAVDVLTHNLQSDKKYQDILENSWRLSVTPEEIEQTIGNFNNMKQPAE